ncbi:hypothetical protein PROFUN_10453 [Planoprotostelium fungivorum]|uniref:Uncharacterized protein n=1 Tax=Planoprotostelium fungivorum TaxID=1890364 RepID=A0A2P6NE33_9EUKA|nr:hypothetical protein PROFUN_10453 [Planoprotostelium fungivorum]
MPCVCVICSEAGSGSVSKGVNNRERQWKVASLWHRSSMNVSCGVIYESPVAAIAIRSCAVRIVRALSSSGVRKDVVGELGVTLDSMSCNKLIEKEQMLGISDVLQGELSISSAQRADMVNEGDDPMDVTSQEEEVSNGLGYKGSAQQKHWTFNSQAELKLTREKLNREAREAHPQKAISLEEEEKVLRWYIFKIQNDCGELRLPDKVQATAISFLKRVHLSFNVCLLPPAETYITLIYIACKVEETRFRPEDLVRELKLKVRPDTILTHEVQLLDLLHFNLNVFHPYRPLNGFVADLNNSWEKMGGKGEILHQAWLDSKKKITDSVYTDIQFLYSPPLIALATLRCSFDKKNVELFESVVPRLSGEDAEKMMGQLEDACRELNKPLPPPPSEQEIRAVESRWRE